MICFQVKDGMRLKKVTKSLFFLIGRNELLLKRYKDTVICSGGKTLIGERPKVPDEC